MFMLSPFAKKSLGKPAADFYDMIDYFFNDNWTQAAVFRMDVKETENEYFVEADLPGIKKEEIRIEYFDDELLISVEKNETEESKAENYIRRERRVSSMQRAVYMKDIDKDRIEAKLDQGVLSIRVPKAESKSGKLMIEVK